MSAFVLTYNDSEISLFSGHPSRPNRARFALPGGLVRSGRISDPNQFRQVVSLAMASTKPHPTTTKQVIIGLPEEHAFIKILEMPSKLHERELQNVFEYQWQHFLPIPRDQVYYDYTVLPETTKNGPTQRVLIVAYPLDIINSLLTIIRQLKLIPKTIIPLSFGFAELYSQMRHGSTLVIKSDTGRNLSVVAVENKVTQFSTTIHAPATSPISVKQLNNIRFFYEKNTARSTSKISEIVIIASPYATFLSQQFHSLNLPIKIGQAGDYFSVGGAAQGELDHFLPHYGLLKGALDLSILPVSLKEEYRAKQQQAIFRSILSYMTTTLVIVLYFSVVFFSSLQINAKAPSRYAPAFTQAVDKESSSTDAIVQRIAEKGSAYQTLQTRRTQSTESILFVLTVLAKQQEITLKTYDYNIEKNTITLTGTRENKKAIEELVSVLTTELKTRPNYALAAVTASPTSLLAEGPSDFSLQITGADL